MRKLLKRLSAKWRPMSIAMGDILYESEKIRGQFSHSFVSVRIKEEKGGGDILVGCKFIPDMYAGPDGAVKNYIYFDIESVERLRDELNSCIDRYHQLVKRKQH